MKDDGGPAFPVFPEGSTGHAAAFRGLSLRDYFAAAALQGLYSGASQWSNATEFSHAAYVVADAMLKERSK